MPPFLSRTQQTRSIQRNVLLVLPQMCVVSTKLTSQRRSRLPLHSSLPGSPHSWQLVMFPLLTSVLNTEARGPSDLPSCGATPLLKPLHNGFPRSWNKITSSQLRLLSPCPIPSSQLPSFPRVSRPCLCGSVMAGLLSALVLVRTCV